MDLGRVIPFERGVEPVRRRLAVPGLALFRDRLALVAARTAGARRVGLDFDWGVEPRERELFWQIQDPSGPARITVTLALRRWQQQPLEPRCLRCWHGQCEHAEAAPSDLLEALCLPECEKHRTLVRLLSPA